MLGRRRRVVVPTGEDAQHGAFADAVPKDAFYRAPLVVDRCEALDVAEVPDDEGAPEDWRRVTFLVRVRDATGKRCPDIAIDATVTAPHRTSSGLGQTDLSGQARFRIDGPPGTYELRIDDVAGRAIALDDDASVLAATTSF